MECLEEQIQILLPVNFLEISPEELGKWYELALSYNDTFYLGIIKNAYKQRGLAWK